MNGQKGARLKISEISKKFGDLDVLKGVSLDIRSGEFVSLVGPSGCGKSTLLRLIAGLDYPTSGSISFNDVDVTDRLPRERDVAMVFQSYALYPHMTIGENMSVPLRMRRLSFMQRHLPGLTRIGAGRRIMENIREEVVRTGGLLHIDHLLGRKPGQLSGGQRQRAALGRAIVRDSQLFLMDEPLSNLDAGLRVQMRSEIAELHRRLGTTFVYVTHDQTEAMTLSHRVAVLSRGRIMQVGPPAEVYGDPDHIEVARFLSPVPMTEAPARFTGSGIEVLGIRIPVPAGTVLAEGAALSLGLRPEACFIDEKAESGLRARVIHRERIGTDAFLHLGRDDLEKPVIIRIDADEFERYAYGDVVGFGLTERKLLWFDGEGARVRLPEGRQA